MPTHLPPSESHPLADFLKPPSGSWRKLRYYSARYGLVHTLCSALGRKWFGFWLALGPWATKPYLQRWLASANPRILNLGGGGTISDRWLTADVDPRSDVFMDVAKPLPLPDGVIDVVYSEEVIEHIDRDGGRRMLAESFRILKPGGILRLTTPSLDYFAKRAIEEAAAVHEINEIFYQHGHRYIYSESAMRQALEEAGFCAVIRSSYRDPASRYGYFDSHPARFAFAPPEWSQYWEAQKPTCPGASPGSSEQ